MNFSYEQTTKIVFGRGKIDSIGEIASQYGKNVLLVTESVNSPLAPLYERVKGLLQQAGLTVHHYDGVVPNPTTESVDAGTQMARSEKVDAVIGIGGGSSMDTAKAVAMAAINEGRAWDYLFFKKQPEKTLPEQSPAAYRPSMGWPCVSSAWQWWLMRMPSMVVSSVPPSVAP